MPRRPKCGEQLRKVTFRELQVDRCTGRQCVWLGPGDLNRVTAQEARGWLSHFWRGFGRREEKG
ncbi:MAG TPA: zf-TFIIB domain-containing protein [Candidatus Binatia bacterium]|nr:zf-TFIIB domain-containing protein [Candidatus Binatia bacterium]